MGLWREKWAMFKIILFGPLLRNLIVDPISLHSFNSGVTNL